MIFAMLFIGALLGANTDLDARLRGISEVMPNRIAFTEEHVSAVFKEPLISSGWLEYAPASGQLSKVVTSPEEISMVIGDEDVFMTREGRTRRLSLRKRPEMSALLNAFRALAQGDSTALTNHFGVESESLDEDRWRLTLTPNHTRLARVVERISIEGQGNVVHSIRTRKDESDWRLMTLGAPAEETTL